MSKVPGQAPFYGDMCLEFLNSEWGHFRGKYRRDDLLQPEWVQEFLERWNLPVTDPLTPETMHALVELRGHMRRIVEALPSGNPPVDDLNALNVILLSTPPVQRLVWSGQKYELEEVAPGRDWPWLRAKFAASFVDLLVNRDNKRLKVCENPYCRCYFYDESKSRTQHWCFDKCANLWKARRYRARQREAASGM